MGAPCHHGLAVDVVIGEVIVRLADFDALLHIAVILLGEGIIIIFAVTEQIELPAVFGADDRDARLLGGG